MSTAPGSIMLASTSPNRAFRKGNRKYANPKATIAELIVTVTAASTPTIVLFMNQLVIGAMAKMSL